MSISPQSDYLTSVALYSRLNRYVHIKPQTLTKKLYGTGSWEHLEKSQNLLIKSINPHKNLYDSLYKHNHTHMDPHLRIDPYEGIVSINKQTIINIIDNQQFFALANPKGQIKEHYTHPLMTHMNHSISDQLRDYVIQHTQAPSRSKTRTTNRNTKQNKQTKQTPSQNRTRSRRSRRRTRSKKKTFEEDEEEDGEQELTQNSNLTGIQLFIYSLDTQSTFK